MPDHDLLPQREGMCLVESEARACILLVDDDARSLYALAEVLRDFRHEVVVASSGEEALRCLLRRDFAVVLLDVRMPGLSGYETAALIRQRERSRSVPIIFLTAFDKEQAHVFQGYEAGAVDYLFKPVDPLILKAKVAVFAELYRKSIEIKQQATIERGLQEERLRAERALLRREEEQALLLRAVPVALYKLPFAPNLEASRFVRGNVEALTGFPAERFLNDGAFWSSRIHPADRERAVTDLARIAFTGTATVEYRWERADGVYRHLCDQAVLVRGENEPGSIFGTWLDVTDRRLLERRLQSAQKLESLGLLSAGVAHDFNNVLTAVSGNLEAMERQVTPDTPLHRAVLTAQRAALRGESLVRQLLSFGRQRDLTREILDLKQVLGELGGLLSGLLRGQVTLELALTDDLWPIEVDPGELELAMLNIVANARDAMAEGGVLRIAATNVWLPPELGDGRPTGDFVALEFRDSGGGIAPEVLERVFEPFVTTKPDGSGLGLSQVYGFAQQAGGEAVIDSSPEGTRVTLYLPRAPSAPHGLRSASRGAALGAT
ncbi:MAG TPA: response regulator [Stellaceae bacterium]|nr:response regulator [Stellaceae bacterium]